METADAQLSVASGVKAGIVSLQLINTTLSDVVNTGASSSGSMVIVWLTSVELPHESTASQVRLWYPAHCSCTAVSVVTIDSMPTLSVNSGVSNTISSPHSTLLS